MFLPACLGLLILYWPVLASLVQDWSYNENYSHGYLIPFIAGYIIYSRWNKRGRLPVQVYWPGILMVLAGLLLLIAATIGAEFFLQSISFLFVLGGGILFLCGRAWFRFFLFPILYLMFMIPLPAILWNSIAFPLQLFVSAVTEQIVSLLDVPMLRQGNMLQLPGTTLEVVDACSGLRSLVALSAFSAALAMLPVAEKVFLVRWKMVLLFLAAVPVAITVNIIRLTVTSLLVYRYGPRMIQGIFHEISGLLVFMLGLGMLFFIRKIFATAK